jgi:HNH endonuclease
MTYVSADLRRLVIERAGNCCEYCLLSQEDVGFTFHAEHHIQSEKHLGATESHNLALSCPTCNSNKGSDVAAGDPLTGQATFLFHPRRQKWSEHFRLDQAIISPLTPEGRVTAFLLKFNDPDRLAEREILMRLRRYPCSPAR